jgi:4'-phosphopantetheinyl transferase
VASPVPSEAAGPAAVAQGTPPDVVHVWRLPLAGSAALAAGLRPLLSGPERARAARLATPALADRFVLVRAALRILLGRYCGSAPERVRLETGPRGKPRLPSACRGAGLEFNVSHAGDLAVLAFALGRAVGVDVEPVRSVPGMEEVVRHFASAAERRAFAALPPERWPTAFLAWWTRKEAFLKARGDGLSLPLDGFDVRFSPGEEARLVRTDWDPSEAARWSMRDLELGPDHVGALVAAGTGWEPLLLDGAAALLDATSGP